eukprot:CAMPEP_0181495432 /NCGR_PEP_ID=MMETSP1110-20121109/52373_1 /TAXON_ID=174948 /ORGANISM="Symbiodinium sp., Strain CCMP421" /LENGTH=67 /DNA_ID=CAMNT_0023623053 /DNA_START=40 /DNA_END=239 /DNA_ORIENTATION=-
MTSRTASCRQRRSVKRAQTVRELSTSPEMVASMPFAGQARTHGTGQRCVSSGKDILSCDSGLIVDRV